MNIPCNHWTRTEDITRSDNLSLDCLDEVDGDNEKLETLNLSMGELESERFRQTIGTDQVERVDELAETKNDDDHDADQNSSNNTDVRTVDVSSATVLTPSRLTLYYVTDTPAYLTHHLPTSLTVPVENNVPIGRFRSAQPHIFLNSETMSRFYGEIRKDRNQVFWMKNVSKNKTIKIQFSKGKQRHCQLLNFEEEVEIKTNYIVTFHTLEFKVVIDLGDCDSVNFEIIVEKEKVPETPSPENRSSHQVIYNQGHIDRLYMNGESTENNSGVVIRNAQLYSAGSHSSGVASQSGLNGLPDQPLQTNGYWAPHVNAGYGTVLQGITNLPQYLVQATRNENVGADNNCLQYRSNSHQFQPESAFPPSMVPIVPFSRNLPRQYIPFGYGQYGFSDIAPSQQQPWSERGCIQPPPPYYPSPLSTGWNQVTSVDASRSALVPSALQQRGPEKLLLPHSQLLIGSSKPQIITEPEGDNETEGESPEMDQGQYVEDSGDFHPVTRHVQ